MAALRRSSPGLAQALERCVADVQDAVAESRAYWLELAGVLAAQRQARPAHLRVVRRSRCLHRKRRRLVTKGWQPRAYDPDTWPACASLLRGVVDCGRRALFSDIAVGPVGVGVVSLGACFSSSPSSRERTSPEAARQEVPAPRAHMRQPSPPSLSREDFDNHAG